MDKMRSKKERVKISPPTDLSQLLTVARFEFLRYFRMRRLLAMVVIIALVTTLILALPPALGAEYSKDAYQSLQTFAQFVNVLVILCATFFGADALVSDFHQRTGYMIFPNPVKRTSIFFGKFLASILASFMFVSLYYLIAILSTLAIAGQLPVEAGLSFAFTLVYVSSAVSVAFLVSSVMRGTTGSFVLTFVLFFFIFHIVDGILLLTRVKPDFSLTFAGGIHLYVLSGPFPSAYPKDSLTQVPLHGGGTMTIYNYIPEVGTALGVMTAYLLITLLLSLLIYRRREMKT